ncbi:hypothetical protein PHYBOEH_001753 [Phytophthora boehmeriae]|uniref:Uncharacterized protein n=1 Tax=Phytophthora boehmeriae TaxID=109152 RepID=A0A8T1X5H1_9STRA|nr:hypothetical protein PHYBOEH_001753 [Phytophthora boehmeriae]
MENLPLSLFSHVVAFAVSDFSEELVPTKRRLPRDSLRTLALVSKLWCVSIRELCAHFQLSTLTLKLHTASRRELLEMRRKVAERGRQVTDLRVSMGTFSAFGEHFRQNLRLPTDVDALELGWDAFVAQLPNLRRLDLSEMPLSGPFVKAVVQAATKHCVDLEALILPGKEDHELRVGAEVDALLDAVYKGLERWSSVGNRRKLRQLTVPTVNEVQRFQSCKWFFKNVVTFCPQVEYLDGYKQSLCEMERLTCQDAWPLALEDWEKFNAACTNLREFNWVVAPFADPYFRVFGEHTKPQLTKLIFCVNMMWDWPQYFVECDKAAGLLSGHNIVPIDRPGYGYHATDASPALRGCPSLTEIEIALHHPLEEDELEDPFNRERLYFPDDDMVNMEIFSDRFWETLASQCPLITRIALWEVVEGQTGDISPIFSFTNRGFIALAQLKYLEFMELRPVNCTGNGIFEFLDRLSDEFTGQRTFEICVGGGVVGTQLLFYEAVMSLLTRVADTLPRNLRLVDRKFVLRLKNYCLGYAEKDWSVDYLKRLRRLVAQVKETHPALRVRITCQGFNGNSFKSMIELGLYPSFAEPSPWYGWDDEESDRDVVFVNRGGVPDEDEDDGPPVEAFDEREVPWQL